MKVLEFDVNGQTMRMRTRVKPRAGSKGGYLKAKFNLDEEYDDAETVVASFSDASGTIVEAVIVNEGELCPFPNSVTDSTVIIVQLTCKTVSGSIFQTNRVRIQQSR